MAKKIPKGYAYTSRYSWDKAKAEERAEKARTLGFSVKVLETKTKKSDRTGYALIAKTTKKGYGWKRSR